MYSPYATEFDETAFDKKELPLPNASRRLSMSGIRPNSPYEKIVNTKKGYQWLILGAVIMTLILWRTATFINTSSLNIVSKNKDMEELMQNISEIVETTKQNLQTSEATAKYWESVVSTMAKSKGMSHRAHSTDQTHTRIEREKEPRTVQQVLDDVKKDAEDSTKIAIITIDKLKHTFQHKHIIVSDNDKKLTAEKLIEVAVAFEIAGKRLRKEAHDIAGDKVAKRIEVEDEVLEKDIFEYEESRDNEGDE